MSRSPLLAGRAAVSGRYRPMAAGSSSWRPPSRRTARWSTPRSMPAHAASSWPPRAPATPRPGCWLHQSERSVAVSWSCSPRDARPARSRPPMPSRWWRHVGASRRDPRRDAVRHQGGWPLPSAWVGLEPRSSRRSRRPGRLTDHAARHAHHGPDSHALGRFRLRLGGGDRHPRWPDRLRRLEVYLETRADPFTERIRLEPDQVAIPGLTDAHLHLTQAALASRRGSRRRRLAGRGAGASPGGARATAWRCLARRARLGLRSMGRLADGGRARVGRAWAPSGPVGARPPRTVGQPRGLARGGSPER